jgi:NAD+ kinase
LDLCLCLGGDGTLLHLNSLFQGNFPFVPPTMAFAAGNLGFLTPFEYKDFERRLTPIISGQTRIYMSLRMRLTCLIYRCGSDKVDKVYRVLNEVHIGRGSEIYMSELDLAIDNFHVATVQVRAT